ncbi:MAG: FAD-dependent oxidoreductase [Acidobacteriota bacterium]
MVGGGPAGLFLSYLLARQGVPVTLLESHADFDRDFRGDTVHPSTLEILDQLGLADRLLEMPHGKVRQFRLNTTAGAVTMASFARLRTKYPFVMMLPQERLLDFLASQAAMYPSFRIVMGATVQELVMEDGRVAGVRYQGRDGRHEVRAQLTVGADGRFSKLRAFAGIEPVKTAPPMDVIWFRLPREAADPPDADGIYVGGGHFIVILERPRDWQVAYVILKGSYAALKSGGGAGEIRETVSKLVPWLAGRVDALGDLRQCAVLSVESSRVPCWHRPGFLLIGDAAHVMSPVGGVGINYAIQDAVEAANLLGGKLREGRVTDDDLAMVQRRREWPVRVIQRFQGFLQDRIAAEALRADRPFQIPWVLRVLLAIPVLRDLPARMIGWGPRPVRVRALASPSISGV